MRAMTEPEAREFLAHNKAGVLSLADQGRAYGVPLYYGYDGQALYFLMRGGLKQQYMRLTSEACFTILRVMGIDDWASVHVFGRLEEVNDPRERISAQAALMSIPLPPEWGESAFGEPLQGVDPTFVYRLAPKEVTGRYSEPPKRSREEKEIALGGM